MVLLYHLEGIILLSSDMFVAGEKSAVHLVVFLLSGNL